MSKPGSQQIRAQFISFFEGKGHSFVPSSPVIPQDDPTLLFANAGMNQFKSIFLGNREITITRAVNSQKCIRAGGKHNDLEEVGKDGYHHTFFEMLGNWSFGDYYKQEAISWAWELLTEVWKLPKDKLYATVHDSDQEAYNLWKQVSDIAPEHISFHGDKHNFWEMGETGPCGPCSEIHFDRGPDGCDKQSEAGHVCAVNGDCARYIELWNLVFIQYNRQEDRSLRPLKNKFVDTGAGLERITQVLQDVSSNYETDLFMPIIEKIAQLSHQPYDPETGTSHRVIADHIRCLCFALADGGFPSNEGRGYVIRRILRRAARHGRLLGFAEPFLYLLVDVIIQVMGHHFTELNGKEDYLKMVIRAEEERFNRTLDTGLERFSDICARNEGNTISGFDAFTLYDTYGFPLDLTQILAEEKGLQIDITGFMAEMEIQKQRARNASKFGVELSDSIWIELQADKDNEFIGYTKHKAESAITRYSINNEGKVLLQLSQTPFYAESGGQVADTGVIWNDELELQVYDVQKQDENIIHYANLTRGSINSRPVWAEVASERRKDIARNHTATHILHRCLKEVLGDHVVQKGSLVHPDYFRFDFAHYQAIKPDEKRQIENKVNEVILRNLTLSTAIQDLDSAKKDGAMALFGEKYGTKVRVVSIEGFSKELCGGTHASSTGELGLFKILTESSSAAGIRRIEGITGRAAYHWVNSLQDTLERVARHLHSPVTSVETKLEALLDSTTHLERELSELHNKANSAMADQLLATAQAWNEYQLVIKQTGIKNQDDLKQLMDSLKNKANNTIIVLFNLYEDKLNIITVVSSDLLKRFHAGKIVALVAAQLEGKGGGRPDAAMAGGKAIEKLPEVIKTVPELISQA